MTRSRPAFIQGQIRLRVDLGDTRAIDNTHLPPTIWRLPHCDADRELETLLARVDVLAAFPMWERELQRAPTDEVATCDDDHTSHTGS